MSQDATSFFEAVIRNEIDPKGKTELHNAAEKNDLPEVERLLNLGANINAEDRSGFTPMHAAAYKNHGDSHLGVLEKLLNVGSNPNTRNCYGETPIFYLVQKGNVEVVRLILRFGADVNAMNNEGETLMFKAVNGGNAEIFKLLLDHGSEVRSELLHRVANLNRGESHVSIAEVLLNRGLNVNARDGEGKTLLHCLIEPSSKIIKLFLKFGADFNLQDNSSETAAEAIVSNENIDVVPLLIDLGVDVNKFKFKGGQTLLHWACVHSDLKVVKSLVKKGMDVNATDNRGFTPLVHLLNVYRITNITVEPTLRFLLKCSDLNATCPNEKEIYRYSRKGNHWKIVLEFIAKLQVLEVPVNQGFFEIVLNYIENSEYPKKCTAELEVAKSAKVDSCWITFFNLLVDSNRKLKNYAGNRDLVKYFKKIDWVEKFPIYGASIQKNVTKGIERRRKFDGSSIALSNNLPVFNPNHLIIRDVLDCLSSKDYDKLVL